MLEHNQMSEKKQTDKEEILYEEINQMNIREYLRGAISDMHTKLSRLNPAARGQSINDIRKKAIELTDLINQLDESEDNSKNLKLKMEKIYLKEREHEREQD